MIIEALKTAWDWLRARLGLVLGGLAAVAGAVLYAKAKSAGRAEEHARQTEANTAAIGETAVEAARAQVDDDAAAAELARKKAAITADAEARAQAVPQTPEDAERENAETAARLRRKAGEG